MADVMLYQGPDGGEITVENGVAEMTTGPFTAMYLSLFGGNVDDGGTAADDAKQWWGNVDEPNLARRHRSRTQHVLTALPAITSNLKRVEEAAEADLAWMLEALASSVTATASIPARNRCRLHVEGMGRDGNPFAFDFNEPWGVPAA
jgi:phage gp46-like protein